MKPKEKKWKRVGKCQPKKCGSICCRLCMGLMAGERYDKKYYKNFGFKTFKLGKKNILIAERVCAKLELDGKCAVHKSKPLTCRVFPETPTLEFYKVCKKLGCTYRFKEIK